MAEHKWSCQHAWLIDKAKAVVWEPDSPLNEQSFVELIAKLDDDDIQDIFQQAMDEDGYFELVSVDTEEDSEEMALIKEGIEAFRK